MSSMKDYITPEQRLNFDIIGNEDIEIQKCDECEAELIGYSPVAFDGKIYCNAYCLLTTA